MEQQMFFSTHTEYEVWLTENKDKIRECIYLKFLDVPFKELQMSARAYNVLRINRLNYMSDIIFSSADDIAGLDMMSKSALDEILMFKRNYLKKHKRIFVNFIKGIEENSESITDVPVVEPITEFAHLPEISSEKLVNVDEDDNIDSTTSATENTLLQSKKMLTDEFVKEKIISFFELANISLDVLNLSTRSYNALRRSGIQFLHQVIPYYPDSFIGINNMGRGSAAETCEKTEKFIASYVKEISGYLNGREIIFEPHSHLISSNPTDERDSLPLTCDYSFHIKSLLVDSRIKEKIIDFFKVNVIAIDSLDLSLRSYNCLRKNGVLSLHQVIEYYPDGFASFRNMGKNSVEEACRKTEIWVMSYLDEISDYIGEEYIKIQIPVKAFFEDEKDPYKLSVPQMIKHPVFKDKAINYLKKNDIPIELMGLSTRATNALKRSGILSFYASLSIYPNNIILLNNIGNLTVNEIKTKIEYYITKLHDPLAAYCNGESNSLYSDEFVYDKVMSCFEDIGFKGVSFKEIRDEIPEDIDDSRIKSCIGSLLADKKLEYVDFRLYRVYPSVLSFIEESSLKEDNKNIIIKKLGGMTLEAIAQEYGLTRERVRQKVNNGIRKLRGELQNTYEISTFDEDYYSYLFTTYEAYKEMWLNFLGVSDMTFGYLTSFSSKGSKPIEEALADPKIDLSLKFKIQDYLNRNKILIDGTLIERRRVDIENYAISKLCTDELTFDAFTEQYNNLLKENGIEFDPKIYYTDETHRFRINSISGSMLCLWKHGERLRYYDIAGQDYTELLETLNLDKFRNIEISTLKFMEDYPDVMEKYDIRDHYELHNLLKKIVDVDDYHDIDFNRQPMIQFGEFNRDEAIYSIFEAVAPVTIEELAEYVHMELGYDKATAMSGYFHHLNQFYHQGVYSINFKRIPEERVSLFKEKLTEDFYYISEIKDLYKDNFGDVDLEEINPLSLKSLGFKVYTTYVVQNYPSAEAYFRHILTSKDIYSITDFYSKYGRITISRNVYYNLRENYDIFLFDHNQIISLNRLSKLGVTKEDIKDFCDKAYGFLEDNTYFTMYSLRKAGFTSELDNLGFDDWFYAGILAMDPRFIWQQVYNVLVLKRKINISNIFSKKDFLLDALSKYDSVDLDDFIADCSDKYGISIVDYHERQKITNAVQGTDFYYDSIMGKFYRNKDYYYAGFDD